MFIPSEVYFEEAAENYPLGIELLQKYKKANIPLIQIDSHNNIPALRSLQNSEFTHLKEKLIIGIRKTHKYVKNEKVSDFLVPFTSSGCTAMCLYCYLVCNYNKCAYLRLFVNREEMLQRLLKTAKAAERDLTFEIGSNSDLVLENTITNNLPLVIEEFAKDEKGYITFPTKFDMVEPLLPLNHKNRVIVRMSVNPTDVIRKIEFRTSDLNKRINAANLLAEAGYTVGILIAPVVMLPDWKKLYSEMIEHLASSFSEKLKKQAFFEIIFMTYSFVQNAINTEAFPGAYPLFDKELMTGRGKGKYCYKEHLRADGELFLREKMKQCFPDNKIIYVV